jgi:RNA polymerase sigma factor (sigma-70 family)
MSAPIPEESLDQLFGGVFDLAGQFAGQISQDIIEARLRVILREVERRAARRAAPSRRSDPAVVALVERAAEGDREAWDGIVERYAPLVWSVCGRYRLSSHDREDVAQVVWLLLVEQLGKLREPAALPGWLATTTARECLRVVTARRATPEDPAWLSAATVDTTGEAADDATVEAEILAAELNATLRAAVLSLPPRCQRLLSMLVSDPPYSYAEISAALGIPVGSIGPQRARCLERLRRSRILEALADEPDQR